MTKRVFQIGDKVRILPNAPEPERRGVVTTITEGLHRAGPYAVRVASPDTLVYSVAFPARKARGTAIHPPEELEPYYEDREPVSWEECLWQPKKESIE